MNRLEEIRNRMIVEKHRFKYLNSEKDYWENVYTLLEEDMKYLFDTITKQAERVEKLEVNANDLRKALGGRQEEVKRYKQALETIAVGDNHVAEFWDIARWALEGEQDNEN